MDRTAVLAGIDDADHRAQELGQVRGSPDLLQKPGVLELGLEHHGIRELTALDPPGDRLVDAPMHRIGKVLRCQKFADPLVGLVVGEKGAKQGLFRLQVGRRQTL